MSYNTRRSGNFGAQPQSQPQVPSVAGIGQRRPVANPNFAAGAQLNAQNKAGIPQQPQQQQLQQRVVPQQQQQQPQPPQQKPPINQAPINHAPINQAPINQAPINQAPINQAATANTGINFRAPNQGDTIVQGYQTSQQQPNPPVNPEPQITNPPEVKPPNPAPENANGESMEVDTQESPKKKPFWMKGGKVTKRDRVRRRNQKFSRELQPKNAVMVLNELANATYSLEELGPLQFKATAVVDDVEHVGTGCTRIDAKNAAAENAIKHLVALDKLSAMKRDEEGNEKMDISEDGSKPPLPWQHVASFALYKLFTSWGQESNKTVTPVSKDVPPVEVSAVSLLDSPPVKPHQHKPSKKLPPNPELMNPLMLMNQMLPHALFEEIGKTGTSPNIIYTYRCTVNEESFMGTGPNKKGAKKVAAFAVCHKILGINYPPQVYNPSY